MRKTGLCILATLLAMVSLAESFNLRTFPNHVVAVSQVNPLIYASYVNKCGEVWQLAITYRTARELATRFSQMMRDADQACGSVEESLLY